MEDEYTRNQLIIDNEHYQRDKRKKEDQLYMQAKYNQLKLEKENKRKCKRVVRFRLGL
jgi:hypothetical protein